MQGLSLLKVKNLLTNNYYSEVFMEKKDGNISHLIYKYRMMGFDKPVINNNRYFNCYTLEINGPCGQWKLIKGNSSYACLIGAIKWAKSNWKYISKKREQLMYEYPRVQELNSGMKGVHKKNYGPIKYNRN